MAETIEISTLGAVIKQAYEAQADTNTFTDAEKQKLDGMEIPGPVQFADIENVPVFVPQSQRGVANGFAPLDASNLVPLIHLNVGGLSFKGAWNPQTNTPTLIDGTGNVGDFYKSTATGTFNFGNGNYNFVVGDWAIYAGGTWQRIGVTDAVAMVNGKIGSVILNAADVGAVSSVNGKMGQSVTLAAADVGALPSNYTPPAPAWAAVTGKPDFPALYQTKQRGTIGPAIPAALIRKTANQVFDTGVSAAIIWGAVVYDPYAMFKNGTQLIIPSWAKYARVSANAQWGGHAQSNTSPVRISPQLNGVYVPGISSDIQFGNINVITNSFITAIFPVASGDVITVNGYQATASVRNIEAGDGGRTWLQVELYE